MNTATHNSIDVEDLKRRVDILAVAHRAGVELKPRGREWWGCCPLHGEKTASFSINPDKQTFHCFGCGKGGDVLTLVMEAYKVDFMRAVEILGGQREAAPIERPAAPAVPSEEMTAAKGEAWRRNLAGLQPLNNSPAAGYLAGRGLLSAFAVACGVMYHPDWSRFTVDRDTAKLKERRTPRPAVVFPIRDQAGELVAAQGRFLDGDRPKMMTAQPGEDRAGAGVFSTPEAFTRPEVIFVESPINALTLAQAGFPAVATCGASHFPGWLPAACAGRCALIGFDPDSAGAEGMQRLAAALAPAGVMVYQLPITAPGLDWNDLLQQYGYSATRAALWRAIRPAQVGDTVHGRPGEWVGTVAAIHPPEADFPGGWVAILTDQGEAGQVDARAAYTSEGIALAAPIFPEAVTDNG